MTGQGFSPTGLERLHDRLAWHVETGKMPGLIALVARHDGDRNDVHVDVIGTKAIDDDAAAATRRDLPDRVADQTDRCRGGDDPRRRRCAELDAPVDENLPELADRRVLRSLDAPLDDTVPATRAITLEDLLTFRLGFGTVMAPPDTYPIQAAERELQLGTLGSPYPPTPHTPDEWIGLLGSLPLMHQPGEQWMYNTGSQVLGVLLERAAGQPLEALLRERICSIRSAMRDTGFSVSADQRNRFTTAYAPDPESDVLKVIDGVEDSYWSAPPAFPNAAGWLVSTIDDFWAFVSMLLADGTFNGERILTQRSVELMTTDHLTPEQRGRRHAVPGRPRRLGLRHGGAGRQHSGGPGHPGGFGWDGGTGTTWRSDRHGASPESCSPNER